MSILSLSLPRGGDGAVTRDICTFCAYGDGIDWCGNISFYCNMMCGTASGLCGQGGGDCEDGYFFACI